VELARPGRDSNAVPPEYEARAVSTIAAVHIPVSLINITSVVLLPSF
jgi:hypothetical protein